MSDITSQTLSEIIKNIREKKFSSQEVQKHLLIDLKNQNY